MPALVLLKPNENRRAFCISYGIVVVEQILVNHFIALSIRGVIGIVAVCTSIDKHRENKYWVKQVLQSYLCHRVAAVTASKLGF